MIVAGFGFSTRATVESLRDALARTGSRVQALATLADKASMLEPLAQALNLPILRVDGALPETPTQSDHSLAQRGTGSVAEACALAAVGPGGYLLRERVISGDRLATCAIAKGQDQ